MISVSSYIYPYLLAVLEEKRYQVHVQMVYAVLQIQLHLNRGCQSKREESNEFYVMNHCLSGLLVSLMEKVMPKFQP